MVPEAHQYCFGTVFIGLFWKKKQTGAGEGTGYGIFTGIEEIVSGISRS